MSFQPDALLYVTVVDLEFALNELLSAQEHRLGAGILPWEDVRAIWQKAGVEPGTPRLLAERQLAPYVEEVVSWAYARLVRDCRERGIRPLFLALWPPGRSPKEAKREERTAQLAREAGFEVIDLHGIYKGVTNITQLWVARWDHHPNAEAHRLIAAGLHDRLVEVLDR